MDKADFWSKTIDRAIDILFAKYPARTGLGVMLGFALAFLVDLFQPALGRITFANFAGAPWWGWLPVGIIVMHSPTLISLFTQRSIGNDSVDQALELIERANFTQSEKRQHYRNLILRVSSNISLVKNIQDEVRQVEKKISNQSTTDE